MRTTVTILFFFFLGSCYITHAQAIEKFYTNTPQVYRLTKISDTLPYTSMQRGHYLLFLNEKTRKTDVFNAGFKVVRSIHENLVVIKINNNQPGSVIKMLEHATPVNYLWKVAEPVWAVSPKERAKFTVKTTKDFDLRKMTSHLSDIRVTNTRNDIWIVETKLQTILNHLVLFDEIEYIGVESNMAQEESRVLDLNLHPNTVNQVHYAFPTSNGSGMTLSIKEQHYNVDDIDLLGRHVASPLGSATISIHATEMATIAAGAGNSFITGRGVARAAKLTSSDFANLSPDRDEDYQALNAWVQNHSYGTVIENFYGALAEGYDQSANRNQGLLHVFSAGNKGLETPATGTYQNIAGFANLTGNAKMAKNVLIVGAADTTGNAMFFSSRGPAPDGRIKPEVVAYSSQGTSNSTALVSGVAIVLQQVYKEKTGVIAPSALIKSILVNTAHDIGEPGPDFKSGYGNVDAYRAVTELRADHFFSGTISDLQTQQFNMNIPEGAKNLKVTLTWNDPAAPANSGKALVNDLDMTLATAGTGWKPWVLQTAPQLAALNQAATRGEDHLNNIEQITLEEPVSGTYTIAVHGYDVPVGPQQFYISYQWDTGNTFEWKFPTGSDNMPYNGETATYFYWNSTLPETTGRLEYTTDGSTWQVIADAVTLKKGYLRWQNIPEIASVAQARMVTSNGTFLTESFTISRPVDTSVGFNCADSVLIQWAPLDGATEYRVYALRYSELQVIATEPDTSFIFQKKQFDTSLFAVEPVLTGKAAIRTPTFNYNALSAGCFLISFYDEVVPQEGVYLNVQLGTTYGIKQILLEHLKGSAFTNIGSVNAGGNKIARFLHQSPDQGYNYYRARVQLINSEEVYSDTLATIFITNPAFQVFPNPVTTGQQLRVFSKAFDDPRAQFKLYRTDGTLLLNTALITDREFIDVGQFPPGLYLYSIQSEEGLFKGKLIIASP